MNPEHVLVAYGSLKPNEANHHVVSSIRGEWLDGWITGEMGNWGPYLLYVPTENGGTKLPVKILISSDLPAHWARLDEFEGSAYERIECDIETEQGLMRGFVYAKPKSEKRLARQDQFRGALLGLACGDAVGTTLEFKQPGSFEPLSDMVGGGPFHLKPGQWTDDTSLALCLSESLVQMSKFDAADQMERYYRWYDQGYLSSTGTCFDIGSTTQRALHNYKSSKNPYSGLTSKGSGGNGSLMRLAPVPLFYSNDTVQAVQMSGESSKTTHALPVCVDACRYYGSLIVSALNGATKEELLSDVNAPKDLVEPIAAIARGSFKHKSPPEIKGSGYVVSSLEAALWAFSTTNDFRTGCLTAANLGDDADTTAAIYGQLAGSFYGSEAIPQSWRDKLHMRDYIIELADALWSHGVG